MTEKDLENVHDTNDETTRLEAVTDDTVTDDTVVDETVVMEQDKPADFSANDTEVMVDKVDAEESSNASDTDEAEDIEEEIHRVEENYAPPAEGPRPDGSHAYGAASSSGSSHGSFSGSPTQPPGPGAPFNTSYNPQAGNPGAGPAPYGRPSPIQSASARLGIKSPDGPIKVGLLVWGVLLLIFGLVALLGGIASPISIQFTFTSLLVVAGLVFIALAVAQNQNKTGENTSAAGPRGPQPQFSPGAPAQPGQHQTSQSGFSSGQAAPNWGPPSQYGPGQYPPGPYPQGPVPPGPLPPNQHQPSGYQPNPYGANAPQPNQYRQEPGY